MAVLAVVLGFSSCSEDDKDPVCQKPTEFVLNTPAMAEQYYELTPDGQLVFTCSQPNYGFTASVTYGIQISLTQDFAEYYDVAAIDPTSALITVKSSEVATGICVLRGIDSDANWVDEPARALYVRAIAQLGTHASTFIASNVITLKQVKGYFAVPMPGFIYMIGKPSGWTAPDEANEASLANWRLFEQEIGSNIYYGCFNIPAGRDDSMFRFYTKLTGWDGGDSWGSQEDDSPIEYENPGGSDGALNETLVNGKGSFCFPNWEGGEMTIIVNMNNHTVAFMAGNQL